MNKRTIEEVDLEIEKHGKLIDASLEEIKRMDSRSGWVFLAVALGFAAGMLALGGILDNGMSGTELIFVIVGAAALWYIFEGAKNRRYLEETIRSDRATID